MTRVDLLRHGEVAGGARFRGHTDDPLTEQGWQQMRDALESLDETPDYHRIISSPLRRCADFAHALSRHHGIPCQLERRLMELHFGAWEGKTADQLMTEDAEALGAFWQDPATGTPTGGESLGAFSARVIAAWHSLLVNHAGKRLLVISHGGVLRMMLCHLLRRPLRDLPGFRVGHACRLRIYVDPRNHRLQDIECHGDVLA